MNVESISAYYFVEKTVEGVGTGLMHPIIDAHENPDGSFTVDADFSQAFMQDDAASLANIFFEFNVPTFVQMASKKRRN